MGNSSKGIEPASNHEVVVPGPNPIKNYRAIIVQSAGTADIVMEDADGNDLTIQYTLTAGSIIPVRPKFITVATATMTGIW